MELRKWVSLCHPYHERMRTPIWSSLKHTGEIQATITASIVEKDTITKLDVLFADT